MSRSNMLDSDINYKLDSIVSNDKKTLDPEQKEHVLKILQIYANGHPSAYDVSEKGMGKSLVVIAISIILDLPIFLICNKPSIEQWKKWASNFGVNIVSHLNYEALRGVRSSNDQTHMKHNYLNRDGNLYEVTDELVEMIQNGCLIVIDESHRTRNIDRVTFESCATITAKLIELYNENPNLRSRILLSSATPCVMIDSITSILILLGVIKSSELYYKRAGRSTICSGFNEMRQWCINNVDSLKSGSDEWTLEDRYLLKSLPIIDNIPTMTMKIYNKYISPVLTSRILSALPFKQNIVNAFFTLNDSDDINIFREANANRNKNRRCKLSDIEILRPELAKTKIVIPFAKSILNHNPMAKIIIYCNYDETQNVIYNGLKDFCNVAIVDGKTEDSMRHDVINRFNKDSDEVQVLISKATVCGTSIDLDDQYGNRPRYTLVMPSYNYIESYQSYGRTCRRGTKSQPHVYNIFIDGVNETGLITSNTNKGKLLESVANGRHDVNDILDMHFSSYDICSGTSTKSE